MNPSYLPYARTAPNGTTRGDQAGSGCGCERQQSCQLCGIDSKSIKHDPGGGLSGDIQRKSSNDVAMIETIFAVYGVALSLFRFVAP
jgi:hypothetical protein